MFEDFWEIVTYRLLMLSPFVPGLPEWCKQMRIENIFRQTDKTCLFLQQRPEFKDPLNVIEFTLLNNPNSWLKYYGTGRTLNQFYKEEMNIFHGAYMVNGPVYIVSNDRVEELKDVFKTTLSTSPGSLHNRLLKIKGLGDFMAHQIVINLQLCNHVKYDEDYVKLGPGSTKGLKLLKLATTEQSLYLILHELPTEVEILKPTSINPNAKPCNWNLETIENCLCIYQKVKSFQATGKTKRLYKPDNNQATCGLVMEKYYV